MKNDHKKWIVAWFVAQYATRNAAAAQATALPALRPWLSFFTSSLKNPSFPSFGCGNVAKLLYPPFKLWLSKFKLWVKMVNFLMNLICNASSCNSWPPIWTLKWWWLLCFFAEKNQAKINPSKFAIYVLVLADLAHFSRINLANTECKVLNFKTIQQFHWSNSS